jgi:hypothetical protein
MRQKLLVTYNIRPNREAEYYRYVLGEFLPELQRVGLIMDEGWHTAYGDYPIRLIAFRAQDGVDIKEVLNSSVWREGRDQLLKLVRDYEERLVPDRNVFQFFIPSSRENRA